MINTITRVDAASVCIRKKPEHIKVSYHNNGNLALSWLYDTMDAGLYPMVKRSGGIWNPTAGGWTFDDPSVAQKVFDKIIKKHPDWPVIGDPDMGYLPLAGIRFARFPLNEGFEACLLPLPLPHFAHLSGKPQIFRASAKQGKDEIGVLIGSRAETAETVDSLAKQGAILDNALLKKWAFSNDGKRLQVKVVGWAVHVSCNLSNPLHYLLAPVQEYRWEGTYPNGIKVAKPWDGVIHTTRKFWPSLKCKLKAFGLEIEGDDPEMELSIPVTFDASQVNGWETPAPNGCLLYAYQKEGAQFCASRGMRAMIGDEMGVGKTVQVIAAAEAVGTPRIFVVCPANARYVWEREIQQWGARGTIQHISNQLDKLNMTARWHIVTYDLIVARGETWRIKDEQERKAILEAIPDLAKSVGTVKSYPHNLSIKRASDNTPDFADPKRTATWKKMMQRLRGELLGQIQLAGSTNKMLVILDEAHRAKNKNSKRTQAIKRIVGGETQLLMLTGTPLRNNEHEAAVLLGLLDAEASIALSTENGYTIQDIKDHLSHFMIRRTKAEVLHDLPEKTRQRIEISNLDPNQMLAYHAILDAALEEYFKAIEDGATHAVARKLIRGHVEMARTALGKAKVRGGAVLDLVLDVVENKGCCVVFCAHHEASDDLKGRLEKENLRTAVVDGRTSQKERARIVKDFQDGHLDVFIGGINAAGEAITLTRADTVIFVELDWVPAALLQAEDRIHRVGQVSNCQIIQVIARIEHGVNLDEMMIDLIGSKMTRIGTVLDESTANIIARSIQTDLYDRLLA